MKRHLNFPIASGILTIISAIMILLAGVISIVNAFNSYGGYGYGFIGGTNIFFWFAGIFELFAFAVGLTGSIFLLKKQQFLGSIFSNILLIVSVVIIMAQSFMPMTLSGGVHAIAIGLVFVAVPALILTILSLIFASVAKSSFT